MGSKGKSSAEFFLLGWVWVSMTYQVPQICLKNVVH